MQIRIYQPAKTAMQSGMAGTQKWVMEFPPDAPRVADPLMGWTSSTDTRAQVQLTFDTKEEAVAFAEKHGLPYLVEEPHAIEIPAQELCRQFPLRPDRSLDALDAMAARRIVRDGRP